MKGVENLRVANCNLADLLSLDESALMQICQIVITGLLKEFI